MKQFWMVVQVYPNVPDAFPFVLGPPLASLEEACHKVRYATDESNEGTLVIMHSVAIADAGQIPNIAESEIQAGDVTAKMRVTLDRIRELRNVMFLLGVHLQQESIDRIGQLENQACEILNVNDADAVPPPTADRGIQAGDPVYWDGRLPGCVTKALSGDSNYAAARLDAAAFGVAVPDSQPVDMRVVK
jgi:hypothetical protein